jgi:hypothetical protein
MGLFTDGEMFQSAVNIMKIYAGSVQKMSSRSAMKPPSLPIIENLLQYATPFPL